MATLGLQAIKDLFRSQNLLPRREFMDQVFNSFEARNPVDIMATATVGVAIDPEATFLNMTSANSGNLITLPSAALVTPRTIGGYVGANGFSINSATDETINNVVAVGSTIAAVPAHTRFALIAVLPTGWLLIGWNNLGAVITPIVPS